MCCIVEKRLLLAIIPNLKLKRVEKTDSSKNQIIRQNIFVAIVIRIAFIA